METRRGTLKILSVLGTTGSVLGQQHIHEQAAEAAPPPAAPYKPVFFTQHEWDVVSRITDLIIPTTDTPGAVAAGVPRFIDAGVTAKTELQPIFRKGVPTLGSNFLLRSEREQIAMLTSLCERADRRDVPNVVQPAEVLFFRTVKAMTVEGYYTSRIGLAQELGYHGGQALPSFPGCEEGKEGA